MFIGGECIRVMDIYVVYYIILVDVSVYGLYSIYVF